VHQAGIDAPHVPYRGSAPALNDLMGNHVQLMFDSMITALPLVEGGKLRALAVTGKSRLPSLPNVPTAGEAGLPKLDATSWFAVFAPAKTPQPVIDRLSAEIAKVMATAAFKQKAAEQGATADYMGPTQLGDYSSAELARWAQVVKSSKIEAD
jgi:tripartite-type tricarboxylate transporter receptor subunit TctC